MASIVVKQFGGIAPRVRPRYIGDTQAQIANNTQVWNIDSLRGMLDTTFVKSCTKYPVVSIYRFGMDVYSDVEYWFEFTSDTNVCRSAIAGDTTERTYYCDGVKPKKTNNEMALGGGSSYPIAAYDLGVPKPFNPCIANTDGAGTGIPETRAYTYTNVTSWGEESEPADPSGFVDAMVGDTITLTALAVPTVGSTNIATKRIYRTVVGTSGTASYLFVAEIAASETTFSDTTLAINLGEVCPSIGWTAPPDGIMGFVSLPNGGMAGFMGRDLYLCPPYRPFTFPASYILTVPYPIVGLGVMDTTVVVLTTGKPSFYQGSDPSNMVEVPSDITQACVSKRSIVSMNGAVLYASPDGIVSLSSAGSEIATQELFTKDQWQQLNPTSIHAYAWENKYVGFWTGGSFAGLTSGGFVYDPSTKAFNVHDVYAQAGYNDLQRDTLYLVIGSNIVSWHTGSAKSYVWHSKKFSLPHPMSFVAASVDAETYPLTIKFYNENGLFWTQTVTERNPFKLPGSNMYQDIEFEVSGTAEVFQVSIAESVAELANV